MRTLFGIPVDGLAFTLAGLLAAALVGLAVVALRGRMFLRLGLRNAGRRRGRAALIVVGLALGTTIITAALATGDTMSQTVRSAATAALGRTDEMVATRGIQARVDVQGAGGTGTRYLPESAAARIEAAARPTGLVAGVAPVIIESVAVRDATSRQNEPRVTLFAADPARMGAFGPMRAGGRAVSLADLRPGEVYLDRKAADALDASPGDAVGILAGTRAATARVRAIVDYQGTGTPDAALLMPLARAQALLGTPGRVTAILVANRDGPSASGAVVRALGPTVGALGLEIDKTKQNALHTADTVGAAFMSMFATFGSFSIAAGILLIVLIFVMLAAERRSELGIARAIGTRRAHLVQMFVYEGAAYDLVAAVPGVAFGVLVAYLMVLALASAFSSTILDVTFSVRPVSVVVGYALGVLLTLLVVAFSAWRVSRMSIASAIRNLPEPVPARRHRTRRLLLAAAALALGALLATAGVRGRDAVTLGFGVTLAVVGLVPLLHAVGAPNRAVHTLAGLALVVWFVLPMSRWLFGDMSVNFSIFLLGGLAIVVGASWAIVYNADLLLGALGATLGRVRRLAPVLRMAMAYPLRSRFRTGITLAMFTLVVFTLVTGATTSSTFINAADDIGAFGGGFDVRATVSPSTPIRDMPAALARTPGAGAAGIRLVSAQSTLAAKARQAGAGRKEESVAVHGVDAAFLDHTTYGLATWARGYGSPAAVWRALAAHPGLAVVDQYAVPRRSNWTFGGGTAFHLSGFVLEDRGWTPVPVSVRDPQTGRRVTLTVIGVLSDTAPLLMNGIWTSQAALTPAFGDRVLPTTYLFALQPGIDPKAAARRLESAFLADGMQADSLRALLADSVSASLTFTYLIEGFMALGLVVGVAALGVITARSVVERRQHIGVLRAIGFRRGAVTLSFLVESSFVALTSIAVGTGLGLAVAYNVIADARRTPSWAGIPFTVPWPLLGVIFLAVLLIALATTLAPALRASRVYPAEALRYQ